MIRAQTRRIVRAIYDFRCGYCGVSEKECGAELTYDHFQPQSHGGTDAVANLIYACHACNEHKGAYWSEADETRLLHPTTDNLDLHVIEDTSGVLQPLTTLGWLFIEQLQLNRPPLIQYRLERQRWSRVESKLADMPVTLRSILSEIKTRLPKGDGEGTSKL